MNRADGYTEEQIKRWCTCMRNQTPDSFDGPDRECPLHGGYVVEWVTFCREVTLLEAEYEPMGGSYSTEEYPDDALERAEEELDSIRRYDEQVSAREIEYQLRYRLIGPWMEQYPDA